MEWFSFVSSMFSFISSLSVFLFAPLFVPFFLFVWVLLSVQDLFFFLLMLCLGLSVSFHISTEMWTWLSYLQLSALYPAVVAGSWGIFEGFLRDWRDPCLLESLMSTFFWSFGLFGILFGILLSIFAGFWWTPEGSWGILFFWVVERVNSLQFWVVWDPFWDSFVYFCEILVDYSKILRDSQRSLSIGEFNRKIR